MARPVEIFFSYSHKDEALMDDVRRQLVIFDRQGIIRKWHDRKIVAGAEFNGVIDERLNRSDIILLFVSADFIESRYCYDNEVVAAMRRHEEGTARVIPVILRHCLWQTAPFGKLLALPIDGRPVSAWLDRDEACMNVAEGIMKVVNELKVGKPLAFVGRNAPCPCGSGKKMKQCCGH
jgi:hypothetical protein